jgi:hypothetical protein
LEIIHGENDLRVVVRDFLEVSNFSCFYFVVPVQRNGIKLKIFSMYAKKIFRHSSVPFKQEARQWRLLVV